MKKIYKYPISAKDRQVHLLPEGAKILSAGWQANQLVLWAEVNPKAKPAPRCIYVLITGGEVPDDASYIATCSSAFGAVAHIYEARS